MELTPREAPPVARRRAPWLIAVAVVLIGLGFVLVNGLRNATQFFLNADEAVAQRTELGEDRFRLQGTVVDGSVAEAGDTVRFEVVFNDVAVTVRHQGDPPELFQPDIPVVLEGRWDGGVFASDRILVKHTSEYEADNSDRLDDAVEGGSKRP